MTRQKRFKGPGSRPKRLVELIVMQCPSCGKSGVGRIRREGVVDQINRCIGRWPYRCFSCNTRFYHRDRWIAPGREPRQQTRATPPPAVPTAQIVVKAETHEQLDSLLLALHDAISSHQSKQPEPVSQSRR